MTDGRSFTFTITAGRPMTANKAHNTNHFAVSKMREEWSDQTQVLCRVLDAPKGLDRVEITVRPFYDKGPLPDTDAVHPSVKAVIDGLVRYGVIPDDSGEHVRSLTYQAPLLSRGRGSGIIVAVQEVWT